jgi:T5SS/PEP-CTERM-associated repeat protein
LKKTVSELAKWRGKAWRSALLCAAALIGLATLEPPVQVANTASGNVTEGGATPFDGTPVMAGVQPDPWNAGATLAIGDAIGILDVTGGIVGNDLGSDGMVTVDGANAIWATNGYPIVGQRHAEHYRRRQRFRHQPLLLATTPAPISRKVEPR